MNTVFVIERIVDLETGVRSTYAICSSRTTAEKFLETHEGMQLVLLTSGEVVPEFIIQEYEIMHRPNDFDPISD